MLRARSRKAPGVSITILLALQSRAGAELLLPLQISSNRCGRSGQEVPHHVAPGRASPSWQTRQWGRRPGDRDLQLPRAAARRCHHAWAAPLIASNAAGCSAGSLRVAGLISRIHLSRKTGKWDSTGTGEARCAEVSETLLCKRQRDKSLLGTRPVLRHLCQGRGYGAAKNSAVPSACPASPTASGHLQGGI